MGGGHSGPKILYAEILYVFYLCLNTVECGNCLRVGVHAKNIVACRGLRVGPSKAFQIESEKTKGGGKLRGGENIP